MCNLYQLESGPDAIRRIFEAAQIPLTFPEGIPNFEPRSVRITDRAPIVRFNRDRCTAELVERRWSWPAPGGKPVFNMRSDGREFGRDRCLVLADGFYEFTAPADPKQWPVTDFVDETARRYAWSPNTSLIAFVSAKSPRGVDVP